MLNLNGIELIARERKEQAVKHGIKIEDDVTNNDDRQLSDMALLLLSVDYEEAIDEVAFPTGWDRDRVNYMMRKPFIERCTIAGALLAAQIDVELSNS